MSDAISSVLKACPLFAHLPQEGLNYLCQFARAQRFSPGDEIIKEGTSVSAMYVIASGVVRVSTQGLGQEVELKKMGEGAYFGEVSLLSGKRTTATVAAYGEQEVEVVRIERDAIKELMQQDEVVSRTLEGVMLARAKDTIEKVLQ